MSMKSWFKRSICKNVLNKYLLSTKITELKQSRQHEIEQELGQRVSPVSVDKNNAKETETSFEAIKKQSNRAILESSLQVSVQIGNEPMALLLKTAIEGINEVLETSGLGQSAIQAGYDSGLDVSPEATADRIVSMSTAFFLQFQQQHAELSIEDAAKSFTEIIGGGIDKGFKDAREILDGLKVLEGDLASKIDATFDLVQEGLKAFVDSYN